jgi:hypothetical protein
LSNPPPIYPPPLAYAPADNDASHLKLLAIFHYVLGGLTALFSCFGLIYVVLGIVFLSDPDTTSAPVITTPATLPATGPGFGGGPVATQHAVPFSTTTTPSSPATIAWVFIGVGTLALVLGWAVAGLMIYSGLSIAARRRRVFSLVVAGVMCLSFPLGTALGVFTIIVLVRDSVRAKYDAAL